MRYQGVERPYLRFRVSRPVGKDYCVNFRRLGGFWWESRGEEAVPRWSVVWCEDSIVQGIAVRKVGVKHWKEG
jgi:hypothetical protein